MAIRDVISRGIGPSTGIAYFITGGFAIGESVVSRAIRINVKARDRLFIADPRDRRIVAKPRLRRIDVVKIN